MANIDSENANKVTGKMCPVHQVEMWKETQDIPIRDKSGGLTFDKQGDMITERVEIWHCDYCDYPDDAD